MMKFLLIAENENIAQRARGLKSKAAWVVSYFGFANLCVLASLRETALRAQASHAKAQSRKENPQSKTLLLLVPRARFIENERDAAAIIDRCPRL
jgi:hypothetical protein